MSLVLLFGKRLSESSCELGVCLASHHSLCRTGVMWYVVNVSGSGIDLEDEWLRRVQVLGDFCLYFLGGHTPLSDHPFGEPRGAIHRWALHLFFPTAPQVSRNKHIPGTSALGVHYIFYPTAPFKEQSICKPVRLRVPADIACEAGATTAETQDHGIHNTGGSSRLEDRRYSKTARSD